VLDQALSTKRGLCAATAGDDPAQAAACRDVTLTSREAEAARAENRKYPFQFQRNPISVSAFLSVPLFNGFQREQRVQEAAASRNDARFNVRAQQLQVRATSPPGCST
jgi:outer membrane protein